MCDNYHKIKYETKVNLYYNFIVICYTHNNDWQILKYKINTSGGKMKVGILGSGVVGQTLGSGFIKAWTSS